MSAVWPYFTQFSHLCPDVYSPSGLFLFFFKQKDILFNNKWLVLSLLKSWSVFHMLSTRL